MTFANRPHRHSANMEPTTINIRPTTRLERRAFDAFLREVLDIYAAEGRRRGVDGCAPPVTLTVDLEGAARDDGTIDRALAFAIARRGLARSVWTTRAADDSAYDRVGRYYGVLQDAGGAAASDGDLTAALMASGALTSEAGAMTVVRRFRALSVADLGDVDPADGAALWLDSVGDLAEAGEALGLSADDAALAAALADDSLGRPMTAAERKRLQRMRGRLA